MKHTKKSKLKMSEAKRKAWKEGIYTKERNKKISETMKRKGMKPQNYKNFRVWNKGLKGYKLWPNGRIFTEEWKRKMSITQTGKKGKLSNAYKHGRTKEYKLIRGSKEYKEWRDKVYKRDDWTCLNCGARCGNGKSIYLVGHHIKDFADYPKLRFDVDNGVTLCDKCHDI